jgi:hypothetical protein
MFRAKTFEEFEKSYLDVRGYPENEVLSTQEDFEKAYIWWLGHFATRLKDRHGVGLADLFTLINGTEPVAELERVQRGESDTTLALQNFLFGCFMGGEEAADCADRVLQLKNGITVDGQAREKGVGNA